MKSRPLATGTLIAYGLPGLAAALPVIPVAVLMPTWYARELGLGFVVTGLVLALARVLDFALDPLIGLLTDASARPGRRYKPWVLCGALLAGSGFLLLAFPPASAGPLWLAGGAVTLFVGWSLFMIPYTAWGAELSDDIHERSRIAASREIAGLVGMLVALAIPAVLITTLGPAAPAPLAVLAVTALVLGVPAITWLLVRVPEPHAMVSRTPIRRGDLLELLAVPACRRTLVCWFVNGIANGLPAVLFPLFVKDVLGLSETALFVLLAVYFGAAVLAAPMWLALARRYGKASAWAMAIAFNMLVFMQVIWLDAGNAQWFFVISALSGATLGADLTLPPSLQADVMGADRAASGRNRTATAFALWTMATKLALAVAVGVAFVGVGSGVEGGNVDPTRVLVGYLLMPLLLKGSVLLMIRRGL
jgi:glycoside/pentoside/hexuronide:cation symporter, GPH family